MERIVLLVDDDENILHGFARTLRGQPYQIYTAQSGEEATWTMKTRNVDVIVVDEKMPGMSGVELCKWVTEKYPDAVRIMLTGHATTSTAVRAINEGAVYHFLTKPCNEFHLAVTIGKALDHKDLLLENRQLTDKVGQPSGKRDRLIEDLEILARMISQDLQKPLQSVSRCCGSLEGQYGDMFDPKAKVLIDNALDAAAEVHKFAVKVLESSHADQCKLPSTSQETVV